MFAFEIVRRRQRQGVIADLPDFLDLVDCIDQVLQETVAEDDVILDDDAALRRLEALLIEATSHRRPRPGSCEYSCIRHGF